MVIEFISLLLTMPALKGIIGALAPFSYLVYILVISLNFGKNFYYPPATKSSYLKTFLGHCHKSSSPN